MCAFCGDYPCEKFGAFLDKSVGYPVLEHDNALLRDKGWEAWMALQEGRCLKKYTYHEGKESAGID